MPTADGGSTRSRAGLAAFAALVLIALAAVAGIGAVISSALSGPGRTDGGRAAPARTAPAPRPASPSPAGASGGTAGRAVLDAEIGRLERFVEARRGLTFRRRVPVTVLDDAAFQRRVMADFDATGVHQAQVLGRLLTAAGLVRPDLDVVAAQRSLLGAGVLGFYDPHTKALVVRGGHGVTPLLREVLVHELTHALDDQYVRLDRPDLDAAGTQASWAFLAVVEGSAKRVEDDYVARMSPADRRELEQEMLLLGLQQAGVIGLPAVLPRLLISPYDYGEPFVRALVARHGSRALDAALRTPPTTSEQILDPTRFDRREPALPVPRPPADGRVLGEGSLGQLMTGILLQGPGQGLDLLSALSGGTDGGLGGSGFPPVATVPGWGGDRYVIYRGGGQTCLRGDWRMDSPAALAAQSAALRRWAMTDPAVLVSSPRGGLVRATRCG